MHGFSRETPQQRIGNATFMNSIATANFTGASKEQNIRASVVSNPSATANNGIRSHSQETCKPSYQAQRKSIYSHMDSPQKSNRTISIEHKYKDLHTSYEMLNRKR